ncbi:MAG: hypothetical protein LIP09_15795 [Bacteroidales bacterium]|nr:hypothetical protein [Bacteroidales bacterium]
MTYLIFAIVMMVLAGIAKLTGLTYNTVNILAYYLALPMAWAFMADRIIHWRLPWLTMAWTVVWIVIFAITAGHFQSWCDLAFQRSVDFLLWFKHWGWDYYRASVYICVLVPIVVTIVLAIPIVMRHPQWHWQPWAVGFVSIAIFLWVVEYGVMTFATTLEQHYPRSGRAYVLSATEQQQIVADTKGMTAKEIVKYVDKQTDKALTFNLSPRHKADEGNCVDYSARFTAIANYAFQANGIKASAQHNVGTIKMFGIDLCRTISESAFVRGNVYYRGALRDHDFVTLTHDGKSYHYDPTFSAIIGYDLKTDQ